jgi:MFS family permease
MVFGLCSAVIFILPPFMFENYLHFEPWRVGIIGLICPLGFLIGSQLVASINKHMSIEQSTLMGLALMLISLVGLLAAQVSMSLILFYCMLFIYGLGGAIFQIVALNMIMKYQAISLHGTVGAIIRMFQNITVAMGTTLSAMLIQHFNKGTGTHGYTATWALAVVVVLAATLMHAAYFQISKKHLKQASAS